VFVFRGYLSRVNVWLVFKKSIEYLKFIEVFPQDEWTVLSLARRLRYFEVVLCDKHITDAHVEKVVKSVIITICTSMITKEINKYHYDVP